MKIQSLEINNFKVFDKKFDKIHDISDASLILFNGPNGYGKTSVFDAIELALTGRIKRFETYTEDLSLPKNEQYNKMLLVADSSKEAWIKLTLYASEQEIELTSKYTPEIRKKRKKESKDNNPQIVFEKFHRTIKIDGEVYSGDEAIEEQLNKYGIENLEDYFDRCCFLSQDENLSFLKETGKDKVQGLNFLFELDAEEQQKKKVDNLISRLSNGNRKYNLGYLQLLKNEEENLQKQLDILDDVVKNAKAQDKESCVYERIFSQKDYLWDKESMEFDQNTYASSKRTLQELLYYAENQEECIKFAYNKPYLDLIKPFSGLRIIKYENNELEYAFRYYSLIKEDENIKEKYILQKKYQEIEDYLKRKEIDKINYEFLLAEDLIQENVLEEIKSLTKQIRTIEKRQNDISTVISSINESRTALIGYMEVAIENQYIDDKVCPLCGNPFDEKKNMKKAMDKETDILNDLCDDATKERDAVIADLYKLYLNSLVEKVEVKLQNVISEDVYKAFLEAKKKEENILEIKKQLEKININLLDKYIVDEKQLETLYKEFVADIRSKLLPVTQEVSRELQKYDWISKYDYYYGSNKDMFCNVTDSRIKNKIKYVENQYLNFNIKQINDVKQRLVLIQNRYKVLENKYNELKKYSESIENGVIAFKKKVLEDVEPLLYVYTAKILQQKFNGRSIMLWEDENLKQIRFVNSLNDTQDILYSMSSGQLAAVSIAFLLCMNQVYAKEKLPILMIDDPIQTIDDVNMVGLVDILRYEFADSQIFISTHEQRFEWYLRYKYEKTGKTIKPFNMKKLLLDNIQ